MTRKQFIESHGATCKNWQWSFLVTKLLFVTPLSAQLHCAAAHYGTRGAMELRGQGRSAMESRNES